MGFLQNMFGETKKSTIILGILLIIVVILAGVAYFFFYSKDVSYDDLDFAADDTPALQVQQDTQPNQLPSSPPSIETISAPSSQNLIDNTNLESATSPIEATSPIVAQNPIADNPLSSNTSANTINQLKYTIKPIDKNISVCDTMLNGKWITPQICNKTLVDSVENLINTNKELIAIEVSGIVDNNPYAGPSSELKQEGLASFRAREAIRIITKRFSNVAVFEGLSIQTPNKRGFQVKAYYLQN